MNINTVIKRTPETVSMELAHREKCFGWRKFNPKAFSKRAGVGYDVYRRFENKEKLHSKLVALCCCLGLFG